jgi:hypothetical protein
VSRSARFRKPQQGIYGYFTFELCHPVLNDDHTRGGIEYVHDQVRMACGFIGKIVVRRKLLMSSKHGHYSMYFSSKKLGGFLNIL